MWSRAGKADARAAGLPPGGTISSPGAPKEREKTESNEFKYEQPLFLPTCSVTERSQVEDDFCSSLSRIHKVCLCASVCARARRGRSVY